MNLLFVKKTDIEDAPNTLPRDILMMLRYEAYVADINGNQYARLKNMLRKGEKVSDEYALEKVQGYWRDCGDEWLFGFYDYPTPTKPKDYFIVMPDEFQTRLARAQLVLPQLVEPRNPYENEVQA